jgi:hypothetical protein
MATYTKRILSGSTNGKAITVVQTASPGDTVHTAVAGSSDMDEIWIYVYNVSISPIDLTLQWGGTAAIDGIVGTIDGSAGMILVAPGLLLNNSLIVKAFATTSGLAIQGFVNRITA